MKIIETGIPDIADDIENEKVSLANTLIQEMTPIIDKDFRVRLRRLKETAKQIDLKNLDLVNLKNEIQGLMTKYSRLKKVRELLGRFEKIFSARIPTGSLKNEFVVLLKILEKVDEKQLDSYLERTKKVQNLGG